MSERERFLATRQTAGTTEEISDEEREALRALGYLSEDEE